MDRPFRAEPWGGRTIFNINDPHYDWWAGGAADKLVTNNTSTQQDRDGMANVPDEPRLSAPDGFFSFLLDFSLSPAESENNRRVAQVNLFYLVNRYHDILYAYGFTEAAGNFQRNNFGLGGVADDYIEADAQDGAAFNNANFSTPPDGRAGRVQMFLWSAAFVGDQRIPVRDGSLDNGVIIHELTHGLSNRLIGNATGLADIQARGMGEGWSDYFSLALLAKEGDSPDGVYPVGQYVTHNFTRGIRRYPYSTDANIFPLTFRDVAGSRTVHAVGEIWCAALWDMRAALIGRYGFQEGQRQSLQLVVDGMKLTPNDPGFIEARDAILLADRVNNGGANQCLLWSAFAKRGLGESAFSLGVNDLGPQEGLDKPFFCTDTPQVRLDKGFYLAGETIRIAAGVETGFRVSVNALGATLPPALIAANLPPGARFSATAQSGDAAHGDFRWMPQAADVGRTFTVTFSARIAENSDERTVTLRVAEASALAVVNAADFHVGTLAADSIAAAFGANLAARTVTTASLPLPVELAGTTVTVNGVRAPLLYVSSAQINFIVPPDLDAGAAVVVVSSPQQRYSLYSGSIAASAPALFTHEMNGLGEAVAVATADGVNYQHAPFDITVNGKPNNLILFGTGLRRAPASKPFDENGVAEAVSVRIDGQLARALYAGAQSEFAGLDQLNIELPQSLAGSGPRRVEVVVTVLGVEVNRVSIRIK